MRGVGLNALSHWTPFYLEEELGMSHFRTGVHFALLTGMGIAAAPVLGVLSDKVGRKRILAPGLIVAGLLSLLVVSTGDSILLAVVLAGVGLFSYALQQIILASVLDITGRGTEAATVGLIFGLDGLVSGTSPFIATVIINHLGGFGSIYYYAGILTILSGLLVMIAPMTPRGVVRTSAA